MSQSLPKILVTSAAGHIGRPTVLNLLENGFHVRAFVRQIDGRSDSLARAGAEIFAGNLADIRDLRRAMAGIDRAFHCPPFSPNSLNDNVLFAIAAEESKLEVVALMTAWNIHATHPSVHQRGHWMGEEEFRWMPSVDVIHLRPGLFAFPYFLGLPAVVHFGQLLLPLGDAHNAPPSNEDIAKVAGAVIADPSPHIGKTYRPTGPTLVTAQDVAETFGRVLGRKVIHRDISYNLFQKAALAQGYPISQIAHMRYYAEEARKGVYAIGAPTDHVLAVTGNEAESFETTARRYISDPSLIFPELQIGTRLESLAGLGKTLLTRPRDLDAWERQRGYPLLRNPQLAHQSDTWVETARNIADSRQPRAEKLDTNVQRLPA